MSACRAAVPSTYVRREPERTALAVIEEERVARKILDHLGLPDTAPTLWPARIDQADFWPTGPRPPPDRDPPWTDDVQQSPADLTA